MRSVHVHRIPSGRRAGPVPRFAATVLAVGLLGGLSPQAFAAPTPDAPPAPAPTRPAAAPAAAAVEPTYDDLTSTLTIPESTTVEYVVDGTVTPAGPTRLTIPFSGKKVTVVARALGGATTPAPVTWTHFFPGVVTPLAPVFNDATTRVQVPSQPGVRFMLDGEALVSGSSNDLSDRAGQTVRITAEAVRGDLTLLTGTQEWVHTFPGKPVAPMFDDQTSTLTIPEVAGVEYVVDGVVVAPGPITYTVPFRGKAVTVVARGVNGSPVPAPQTWKHTFPEVVTPEAPTFDDAVFRVKAPSRSGVQYVLNDTTVLTPGSWNDLGAYAGQTVRVSVRAVAPSVTIFAGTTEWVHALPARAAAPEFDDLTSTLTIPAVAGVEYLVDGVVTPAGPITYTVPFRGTKVTVTARSTTGGPAPVPASWVHTFPEVVTPEAPTFDDAQLRVRIPGRLGVQYVADGVNDGKPLPASSYVDLAEFAGKTVRIRAVPVTASVTLLTGTTEWVHAFPERPQAPLFDDLTSTITIPAVAGIDYLVDGQPVPAGAHQLPTVPFKGTRVTVTVRAAAGSPEPAPATWTHLFPEVIASLPAPEFDDGQIRVKVPSRAGIQIMVEGSDTPLVPGSWNSLADHNGKTVRLYARPVSPAATLIVGTLEWLHTFPPRPTYALTGGDEFNDTGVSTAWKVYADAKSTKGKSFARPENATVHDGVLDLRTSRHCLASATDIPNEANRTEAVCPAGTLTRYSVGRLDSGFVYGMPKSMEVRARLDADHHGITTSGWMHNDQPFCSSTTRDSDIAEMDTMEMWATDYSASSSHITCENGGYHSYTVSTPKQNLAGDWHTWRVDWDGYVLRYSLDGVPVSGKTGPLVTADNVRLSQQRFTEVMNSHQWQVVINAMTPAAGGWAPWIDDSQPFRDRHDLFDYVRVVPQTTRDCAPIGAIAVHRAAHPELGTPTGCETDAGVPGARMQRFTNGLVLWSPATGAQQVTGALRDKFMQLGGASQVGLPTEPAVGIRDGGSSQRFATMTIFWSPGSGAHFVRGRILARYAEMGWENSGFGYPTTDEICGLRDGGCFQRFQGENGRIYWSPATDAHFIRGRVFDKFAELGFENGTQGYPTTDEICGMRDGGCFQRFQREDTHIYWSLATDAHMTRGRIFARYGALGWENGALGYPTTDEICGMRDGGCFQRFQHDRGHIYWSPATDAYAIWGRLEGAYASVGWETGAFAYPVSDPICGLKDGGCVQRFQGENGLLYVSNSTGAYGVQGLIALHYASQGWENGRLGYPTGPERCGDVPGARECTQRFQGGTVVWNSATGIRG